MFRRNVVMIAAFAFLTTPTFALFCPTNFNQIQIGDTQAQVEAQCGKPAAEKTSKEEANVPQEWTYFATLPPDPLSNVGSVKMVMSFIDGKVINLSSGGYSIGSTNLCNGNTVQVGSTMKQVIAACGQAAMINKADPRPGIPQPKAIETSEWKYASTPPITLKFVSGRLTARE